MKKLLSILAVSLIGFTAFAQGTINQNTQFKKVAMFSGRTIAQDTGIYIKNGNDTIRMTTYGDTTRFTTTAGGGWKFSPPLPNSGGSSLSEGNGITIAGDSINLGGDLSLNTWIRPVDSQYLYIGPDTTGLLDASAFSVGSTFEGNFTGKISQANWTANVEQHDYISLRANQLFQLLSYNNISAETDQILALRSHLAFITTSWQETYISSIGDSLAGNFNHFLIDQNRLGMGWNVSAAGTLDGTINWQMDSTHFNLFDSTQRNLFSVSDTGVLFGANDSTTIYATTPTPGTQIYCSNCTGDGITGRILAYIAGAWRRLKFD